MKSFQTFLAWSCAILFTVTGIAALFLFNIERKVFSADTFKQAFEKQGLYSRIPAILAEALQTSLEQDSTTDPFLQILTVEEWEAGITILLPPEDLKILSDSTLDSLFAYLNNETNTVSISLLLLKARLAGPQGVEVIKQLINAQPDCSTEQLIQMGLGLFTGDVSLCKPPDELMELLVPTLTSQLQMLVTVIPDNITLIATKTNSEQVDPRIRLNRIRTIMKFTVILPLFLLAMLTLLVVRNLIGWLKWWGYPFLVTGVVSLCAGLVSSPVIRFVVQGVMQQQAGKLLPPILIPTLAETAGAVARQVLVPVIIQSAILGVVGFGMVMIALILKAKH